MANMTCVHGCIIWPGRVSKGILLLFYSPLQVHYCSLMIPFSHSLSLSVKKKKKIVSLYDVNQIMLAEGPSVLSGLLHTQRHRRFVFGRRDSQHLMHFYPTSCPIRTFEMSVVDLFPASCLMINKLPETLTENGKCFSEMFIVGQVVFITL